MLAKRKPGGGAALGGAREIERDCACALLPRYVPTHFSGCREGVSAGACVCK